MSARQSSAVDRALRLVRRDGLTPYAAARRAGIALSTIYRAIERQNTRRRQAIESAFAAQEPIE